jgi:PPK2 family polyphosphate:nucleotide phosphotransferase
MKLKTIVRRARKLAKRYRITDGGGFRLTDIDPSDTGKLERGDRGVAQELLTTGIQALAELQERLYAQDRWAVLLVFQAIDAAGKDSAIKHVMSGINPQGCQVYSFGVPSAHDLDHDYLWRCLSVLPERGRIGIFNRSYYEEVIVVRVHPEFLARQKVPATLLRDKDLWKHRFEDICNMEQYLSRNGVLIRKFFLHVSKKEQKKRFLERLDKPEKNWKFNPEDLKERERWGDYQAAYEKTIRATATRHAPWYIVPADHKWFTRLVVASAIIEGLAELDLRFPEVTSAQKRELARARRLLQGS